MNDCGTLSRSAAMFAASRCARRVKLEHLHPRRVQPVSRRRMPPGARRSPRAPTQGSCRELGDSRSWVSMFRRAVHTMRRRTRAVERQLGLPQTHGLDPLTVNAHASTHRRALGPYLRTQWNSISPSMIHADRRTADQSASRAGSSGSRPTQRRGTGVSLSTPFGERIASRRQCGAAGSHRWAPPSRWAPARS